MKKSQIAPAWFTLTCGTAIIMSVLLAFGTGARAAPLSLSGLVSAGTFSIDQLQSLDGRTETVTVGSVTNNYTGVPLWSLLGGTSSGTSNVIPGTGKNAILRIYILAGSEGGARSLISLGEINPRAIPVQFAIEFLAFL